MDSNDVYKNMGINGASALTIAASAGTEANRMYADLSQATAATINSLRQAFQIQRIYERDARGGTLTNCTITGNTAGDTGGGSHGGTLTNCTITGNTATSSGGGSSFSTLTNCILS